VALPAAAEFIQKSGVAGVCHIGQTLKGQVPSLQQ
jgi:hypothetical protein